MTSPLPELLLTVAFVYLIGHYYLPPLVLVVALRDTNPEERALIVREINVFFRRKRRGEEKDPPRQLTT